MLNFTTLRFLFFLGLLLLSLGTSAKEHPLESITKETLGKQLFFDTILSKSHTQSCATCHNPNAAFIDNRENNSGSLGHDNFSLGDRNTPTAAYANQTPSFHKNAQDEYVGGLFWDGRADDLAEQAGGPPLNPIEMGMTSKKEVAQRLKNTPHYYSVFTALFGQNIFSSSENVYKAVQESIATFEKTDFFSPFDSKYDRYLDGNYLLTEQEELGMSLFFSEQFTNCNACHLLNKRPLAQNETFSDYRYHNIGVPTNIRLREANKLSTQHRDAGLLNNPNVSDKKQAGKFKTPSLRNIALTAPYMHNGVFNKLETVIAFYNQYNSKKLENKINPETGTHWQVPEISENIALDELSKGSALNEKRINALVSFLKLLTDKRYEHLIKE